MVLPEGGETQGADTGEGAVSPSFAKNSKSKKGGKGPLKVVVEMAGIEEQDHIKPIDFTPEHISNDSNQY